ncbi:peptidoglycan bridge formation glycyltransferase FemA/FemB family protein [archaeon]|jgi:peptidoglycan pentaglycine glycine transferase (the first glycine)|nr:peptidoglycan bridge formation glycyltransferase FemA/FemB family protein [archaeon]
MEIKLITDENFKDEWNNFVIENSSPASFLQSWEYSEFVFFETQNLKFGFFEKDRLIACVSFFKKKINGNKYFLKAPKGLVLNKKSDQKKILELLAQEIKKIAKQENIIFCRIAPPYEGRVENLDSNFKKPKLLTNLKEPENTLILDLSKSEDELLKLMHQKTRYNIRLAEKKEVVIKQEENVDVFYDLIQETAKRDKINIFDKKYYQNLFNSNLNITQFVAYHENQPLSSIIVVGYGDTATYFYGASSDEKRNLMPNYLIQWKAIQWAKERGYKYYDFWGVSEDKGSWGGITKFKKGFTGQEINFMGTFDYILNKKWYNIFRIGKFLRNII